MYQKDSLSLSLAGIAGENAFGRMRRGQNRFKIGLRNRASSRKCPFPPGGAGRVVRSRGGFRPVTTVPIRRSTSKKWARLCVHFLALRREKQIGCILKLPVQQLAKVLTIGRSSVYDMARPVPDADLMLMRVRLSGRRVQAWRVSIAMDISFCIEALEEAHSKNEKPETFNTDQGSQFTSEAFIGRWHPHQHGWPGTLARQRLRRAPVEIHQV
jgi:hypothetical protein